MLIPKPAIPILLLFGFGVLLIRNHITILDLEKNLARSSTDNNPHKQKISTPLQSTKSPFLTKDNELAWDSIREVFEKELSGGKNASGSRQAVERIRAEILLMSAPELEKLLDQITHMEISIQIRNEIEKSAQYHLNQASPKTAVYRHARQINQPALLPHKPLIKSFKAWASKDPQAATQWLDDQTRTGIFKDVKLSFCWNHRIQLEIPLLQSLIFSDLDSATARLSALDTKTITNLLQQAHLWTRNNTLSTEYFSMARKSLSDEDSAKSIGKAVIANLNNYSLDGIKDQLNQYSLSPTERSAAFDSSIPVLAGIIGENLEKVPEVHHWLKKETPEHAARLTGNTLANSFFSKGDPGQYENYLSYISSSFENTSTTNAIISHFMNHTITLQDGRFGITRRLESINDSSLRDLVRSIHQQNQAKIQETE